MLVFRGVNLKWPANYFVVFCSSPPFWGCHAVVCCHYNLPSLTYIYTEVLVRIFQMQQNAHQYLCYFSQLQSIDLVLVAVQYPLGPILIYHKTMGPFMSKKTLPHVDSTTKKFPIFQDEETPNLQRPNFEG